MQGSWTNRRRLITCIILVFSCLVLIFLDQWSKTFFTKLYDKNGTTVVIKDFFYLTFVKNSGSAYSFLSGVSWGQTFFKILTPVALVLFVVIFIYAIKKNYLVLSISVTFFVGGTVGNFIDRIFYSEVTDFLNLRLFGNSIFGVFNFADVCVSAGLILIIIHLLFLDKNSLFRGKKKVGKTDNG